MATLQEGGEKLAVCTGLFIYNALPSRSGSMSRCQGELALGDKQVILGILEHLLGTAIGTGALLEVDHLIELVEPSSFHSVISYHYSPYCIWSSNIISFHRLILERTPEWQFMQIIPSAPGAFLFQILYRSRHPSCSLLEDIGRPISPT